MKSKTQNYLFKPLLFIIALFLLVSCSTQGSSNSAASISSEKIGEEDITVSFETESVYFTREELLTQADLIFAGKVLEISPTRWNQDSGEYWTETTEEGVTAEGIQLTTTHSAWPVYEIRLAVTEPIVDQIGVGQEVVLTLLGKSPVDAAASDTASDVQVEAETVNLKVDQELVVFAVQTELAWRDPSRPVELITSPDGTSYFDIGKRLITTLMGIPANAYLVKGSDGLFYHSERATNQQDPISLDNLIQDISQMRETANQQ